MFFEQEDENMSVAALRPPALAPEDVDDDRLSVLRARVARVRELKLLVADLEERTKTANKELIDLTRQELPDAFAEAGVRRLDLDASGNLPPYEATLKPFYKAVVSAEWEPERQAAAFRFLENRGAEDLVKTTITVELGRGERELARAAREALRAIGIVSEERLAVAWNTLTAWLKEAIERRGEEFSAGELETIGAQVGQMVEVKEAKRGRR